MNGKWMFRLWAAVWIVWGTCLAAAAAPPWSNLNPLKGVDADPDKAYALDEANGPWMILACTFSGDGAEKQAKELAYELRKRYKLPAYTHSAQIDPGEAPDVGIDRYGNPRKGKYWKYKDDKEKAKHPKIAEFAVLVGNYQSVEDPEAQKALRTIKYAMPQCLDVKDGKETHQDLSGWRKIQQQVYEAIGSDRKKFGPMSHAMVITNPMLPSEYFTQRNGVDEEIVALNKGVSYSLLDCPGKYTVRVATFRGQVIIKQDDIRAVERGIEKMDGKLVEAAKKADKLATALRMKGYEAYQFHDRYSSIVTVGSFNSVGTMGADGQPQFSPEVKRIVQTFGTEVDTTPAIQNGVKNLSNVDQRTLPTAVKELKKVVGISFDVQPIPIEVPKRAFSVAMRTRE
jgi:hypothetical protein